MDLGQLNEPSPVLEGLAELLDFELWRGDAVDALDLEPALVDLVDAIAHERGVCAPVCSKCYVGSASRVVRRCGSRLWLHCRARVSNNSCSFSTSSEGDTASDGYIREETWLGATCLWTCTTRYTDSLSLGSTCGMAAAEPRAMVALETVGPQMRLAVINALERGPPLPLEHEELLLFVRLEVEWVRGRVARGDGLQHPAILSSDDVGVDRSLLEPGTFPGVLGVDVSSVGRLSFIFVSIIEDFLNFFQ